MYLRFHTYWWLRYIKQQMHFAKTGLYSIQAIAVVESISKSMINGERGPKVGASLSYRNVKERVIIGSVLYICSGLAPLLSIFLHLKTSHETN